MGGSGQSVMEMSHRSGEYQAIIDKAEATFREIMNVPDNYKVLFLQGGASTQFAMVPLNLGNKSKGCRLRYNRSVGKEGSGRGKALYHSQPNRLQCRQDLLLPA